MYQDIKERTFQFGVSVVNLVAHLQESGTNKAIINQILRSGTSVGANVEEAHASFSRKDFIYTMNIALKEARETHYWLRLMRKASIAGASTLDELLVESEELKKILGAIVSKLRGKNKH